MQIMSFIQVSLVEFQKKNCWINCIESVFCSFLGTIRQYFLLESIQSSAFSSTQKL